MTNRTQHINPLYTFLPIVISMPCQLHTQGAREEDRREETGIWSLGWGADGQTLIAGTSTESIHVYDANIRRVSVLVDAPLHEVASCQLRQEYSGHACLALNAWHQTEPIHVYNANIRRVSALIDSPLRNLAGQTFLPCIHAPRSWTAPLASQTARRVAVCGGHQGAQG